MATVPKARTEKSYRMDIRLTQAQREEFERAAALKGMTLTQWSTWHLADAARADIEDETTISLSGKVRAPCRRSTSPSHGRFFRTMTSSLSLVVTKTWMLG